MGATNGYRPTQLGAPDQKQQPTVQQKPTETQQLPSLQQPTVQQKPTGTQQLPSLQQPTVSQQPTVQQKPTGTQQPTVSQQPTVQQKPTETQQLPSLQQPTVQQKPTETQQLPSLWATDLSPIQAKQLAGTQPPAAPQRPAGPQQLSVQQQPAGFGPQQQPAGTQQSNVQPAGTQQPASGEDIADLRSQLPRRGGPLIDRTVETTPDWGNAGLSPQQQAQLSTSPRTPAPITADQRYLVNPSPPPAAPIPPSPPPAAPVLQRPVDLPPPAIQQQAPISFYAPAIQQQAPISVYAPASAYAAPTMWYGIGGQASGYMGPGETLVGRQPVTTVTPGGGDVLTYADLVRMIYGPSQDQGTQQQSTGAGTTAAQPAGTNTPAVTDSGFFYQPVDTVRNSLLAILA